MMKMKHNARDKIGDLMTLDEIHMKGVMDMIDQTTLKKWQCNNITMFGW